VEFRYSTPFVLPSRPTSLWDFAPWLPLPPDVAPVTMGEGGTPLLPAHGDYGCRLWLKDETRNPTGSQKDRALSVAVTAARTQGLTTIVLASAGSTGLAASAYAARAGLRCVVLVPSDTPPTRRQVLHLFGAEVLRFPGPIDDALALLARLRPVGLAMDVSTTRAANPYQAEAPRTIAFEIVAHLGHAPDWLVVPTGGGGTLAGIARGFAELVAAGLIARGPRLVAVVPSAYNALARAMAAPEIEPQAMATTNEGPTILNKLAHSWPPDGIEALAALRASEGRVVAVTDAATLAAQAELGHQEGLFVEPSSSAGLAALQQLVEQEVLGRADEVMLLLTGGGFRELATQPAADDAPPVDLPAQGQVEWLHNYLAG
jgi:threonine synthase